MLRIQQQKKKKTKIHKNVVIIFFFILELQHKFLNTMAKDSKDKFLKVKKKKN